MPKVTTLVILNLFKKTQKIRKNAKIVKKNEKLKNAIEKRLLLDIYEKMNNKKHLEPRSTSDISKINSKTNAYFQNKNKAMF